MTPSPDRPTRALARVLALLAAAFLVSPTAGRAQELGGDRSPAATGSAIAYTVRTADGGWGFTAPAGDALPDLDTSTDPSPLRVLQSHDATWVGEPGDPLTVHDAVWVLQQGVPVTAGPGGVMVRGWRPSAWVHDVFSFQLERGPNDRDVAGTAAEHYRLTARIDRSAGEDGARRERVRVTADLWLLPGVPFSWAPFGADPRAIPTLLPRLRDALGPRLYEIGLVGRAVVRVRIDPVREGRTSTRETERLRAFEIAELGRSAESPAVRGPVIGRTLVDAMERLTDRHPRRVCDGAAHGELPALLRSRVTAAQHAPLLTLLSARCHG